MTQIDYVFLFSRPSVMFKRRVRRDACLPAMVMDSDERSTDP